MLGLSYGEGGVKVGDVVGFLLGEGFVSPWGLSCR